MAQLPTALRAGPFSSPAWAYSAMAQQLTARKPEPSLSLADTLALPTCLADVWDQAVRPISYLRRLDVGLYSDWESATPRLGVLPTLPYLIKAEPMFAASIQLCRSYRPCSELSSRHKP